MQVAYCLKHLQCSVTEQCRLQVDFSTCNAQSQRHCEWLLQVGAAWQDLHTASKCRAVHNINELRDLTKTVLHDELGWPALLFLQVYRQVQGEEHPIPMPQLTAQ